MKPENTALILIGYQNDYFNEKGALYKVIEKPKNVLKNTVSIISALVATSTTIISTPIVFTEDYSELNDPVGILKTIKEIGAFKAGTNGAETIPEIKQFGDRILEVPGKRGLNAFAGTNLYEVLKKRNIQNVVLAGAVTSICIDSTGRSAFEFDFNVSILSDCTTGRSIFEQDFYCKEIFPLYARTFTYKELLQNLAVQAN
jgi:nicotinamidase-related amidase